MAGLHLAHSVARCLKSIMRVWLSISKNWSILCLLWLNRNFRGRWWWQRSDAWVQTCADIFGLPFTRPVITEAGASGAAIIARGWVWNF